MQVNCKVEALNLNVGSTWQRETMMNNRNGMYVTMLPESVKFCILSFLEGFHQRRMFFWMVPTRNPVFFWRGPTQTFIFLTGSNALPYVFDGFQRSPLFFWRVPMQSLIFWRVPMQSLIFFDGFQRSPLFFLTGSNATPYFFWRVPIHLFFWRFSMQSSIFLTGCKKKAGRFPSNASSKLWTVPVSLIFWRVPMPPIKKIDGFQCNPSKLLTVPVSLIFFDGFQFHQSKNLMGVNATRQNFWRLSLQPVKTFDGFRCDQSNIQLET